MHQAVHVNVYLQLQLSLQELFIFVTVGSRFATTSLVHHVKILLFFVLFLFVLIDVKSHNLLCILQLFLASLPSYYQVMQQKRTVRSH